MHRCAPPSSEGFPRRLESASTGRAEAASVPPWPTLCLTNACGRGIAQYCRPRALSFRSSQDLLAIAECDLTECLDIHLGVNLGGIRRSVPDKITDRLE